MSDKLPDDWIRVTLGAICTKPQYGWTCRASQSGQVKYVRTTDISAGEIDWQSVPYCEKAPNDLGKYQVRINDILVSRAGSVGVSLRISQVPCEAVFASYLIRFRTLESVEPQYVEYFLKSEAYWEAISEHSAGVAVPNVNASKLSLVEVPLASHKEQKRIVAKLEKLSAKVDACQKRLAKIPLLLKRFRQSVLDAACSGKLTADWRQRNPPEEKSEELKKRILNVRADYWRHSGRKGQCPKGPSVDLQSLPDLPDGWAWVPLGLLGANPFATVQTGPFGALLHKDEFMSAGVPVVAVGNLTGMGFTKEGLYFISLEKANQLSRFDVRAGDVLFARSGATLGKVCLAPPDAVDWRMTGHILRVRLNSALILPEFCVYALRGDSAVTAQVFGSVQGTTRPGYNTSLLESISLPVAPLAEQQEILRRVTELFILGDEVEARYAKAKAHVDKLTQSILAKAFRGELVPQDPNDEPAEKLLERIKQQKSNPPGPVRKTRRLDAAEPQPNDGWTLKDLAETNSVRN